MKMTIGHFLFRRLREIGVSHIFGVPGDFNLQLLEQLSEIDGIDFVGTCNELNASYAADGYARANGIGAMLTTYGVGDLSAICGLAGACAEHVPGVLISPRHFTPWKVVCACTILWRKEISTTSTTASSNSPRTPCA